MASSSHHSSGLRLGAVAGGGPKGPTGNLRMPPLAISPNLSIQAEAHGEKGVRKQMEDEHLVCPSLRAVSPQLPASLNMSVFGIFDGHGGRQSAAFVRSALPAELANQLMTLPEDVAQQHPLPDRVVREVLTNAFIKIDSRIATETPNCKGEFAPAPAFVPARVSGDSLAPVPRFLPALPTASAAAPRVNLFAAFAGLLAADGGGAGVAAALTVPLQVLTPPWTAVDHSSSQQLLGPLAVRRVRA
eukprot:GHVT01088041.1.p1 GENE.GHVT01088041.1~~GHVT01088041.1.p1  ORF type:complete len:245 (+),score=59.55 GHVT01088041.1:824-1558(+)